MKQIALAVVIALALGSLSPAPADTTDLVPADKSAALPSLAQAAAAALKPTPLDEDIVPTGPLTLTWSQIAPPELVRYDVYFGSEESPQLVSQNQKECQWTVEEPLPPGDYYWRVIVRSADGYEVPGPLCRFCVPHWIQAAVEGTDIRWTIQHPGTYSAVASQIAVRSNSLVWMEFETSGNLAAPDGDEIDVYYSFGDSIKAAKAWGWTLAGSLENRCYPIWPMCTHHGWGVRQFSLWQKLIVGKCNSAGVYENAVLITFCSEP